MLSGRQVIPYYTWLILVKGCPANRPHKMFAQMTETEQIFALAKITKTVYETPSLAHFAETDQEAVILRIFSNVFNAYKEWLGKYYYKVDITAITFIILDDFQHLYEILESKHNASKDFIKKCFKNFDPNNLVNPPDEHYLRRAIINMHKVAKTIYP